MLKTGPSVLTYFYRILCVQKSGVCVQESTFSKSLCRDAFKLITWLAGLCRHAHQPFKRQAVYIVLHAVFILHGCRSISVFETIGTTYAVK